MNSRPIEIADLIQEIRQEIEKPGAGKKSLRHYLIEEKGFTRGEAEALAENICRKLLQAPFPPITEMELMLTEDCNQRCDYCFVEGKNEFNAMGEAVARKAVEFLFLHSRGAKEVKILFFGGEPMLAFDLIVKITLQAEELARKSGQNVRFNMTTNGTLFNEERAAFLGEHRIKFLLSIDGDRETHDRHRKLLDGKSSYEKIREDLPLMKRYQLWQGTRLTAHPDTVHKMYDNILLLAGLGINHFVIGAASGVEWSEEGMDTYCKQMIRVAHWLKERLAEGRQLRISTLEEDFESMGRRKNIWGCRAGRHSITITARGEIFPCSKMLGVEGLKGLFPLGTLEEGFTGIYNRLALCGMIPIPRPTCRECSYADYCMGGCFATNYQATGSIFQPGPLECRWTKKTVAMVKEVWKILGPEYFKKLS